MWREPRRQPLILPGRQEISDDQASHSEGGVKKPSEAACNTEIRMIARTAQSAPLMELFSWRSRSHFQLASRELPVCREVFFAGSASHLLGERRRGGLLVPTNLLEVVPYILFIKRVLGFPW